MPSAGAVTGIGALVDAMTDEATVVNWELYIDWLHSFWEWDTREVNTNRSTAMIRLIKIFFLWTAIHSVDQ